MPNYTSGDYVYFNNITDKPKIYHVGFILNQRDDMYITSPLNILEETYVPFPKIFFKKFLNHG